jgi:hypothetical protein
MKPPAYQRTSSGFALIITLIMLSLAAVIAVVLLTNASIDRTTATSFNQRFAAEVAAQNGLEAAKKALVASPSTAKAVTADDDFLVLRADGTQKNSTTGANDAYYFIARARAGSSGIVDCYPLFSGGTPSQLSIDLTKTHYVQKPQAPTTAFSNPASETAGSTPKFYPQLYTFQQGAYTQWQDIVDPNDPAPSAPHTLPYQRYTFWVEDLAGYVDAGKAGNENGGSSAHLRVDGTDVNEIAMFTVFDPTLKVDSGSTEAKKLIDSRPLLFTVPTMKQIVPPASGKTDLTGPNLAVPLGPDIGGEQSLVPLGFQYGTEGKAKQDLAAFIKAGDVPGITNAITTGLGNPGFSQRAGGNADYLNNIAANIIDYTIPGNAPTTDGSTYRGIGAFPFFISDYDLVNWVKITSPGSGGGDYTIDVKVATYIQLWNPHNIPVSGSVAIHYNNVDKLTVNGQQVNFTPPPDLSTNVSMNPNEYKVLTFSPQTYTFDWGPTPPAANATIPLPGTTANFVNVLWNGKLADRQKGLLVRSSAPVGMHYNPSEGSSNATWRGNTAPPIFPATGGSGDARASYYGQKPWTVAAYSTNSSWGGRPILNGTNPKVQIQPTTWPDGGHDSTLGMKPTGDGEKPDAAFARFKPAANDQDMWVSCLSTKGTLQTLAELGNVFDPSQWSYSIPTYASSGSSETFQRPDIPASATKDPTAGGGYTLAIGRPEFSLFDKNLQRAWQLLDIFGLGLRTNTIGVININTASFETLRALAAGILLNRDKATGSPLYTPTAAQPTASEDSKRTAGGQADLFAQAVIDSRPFLSMGQLSSAANSIGPFFGNGNQFKDMSGKPLEPAPAPQSEIRWNDSGREEIFSKVFNLANVRSRNFRIFVTGQSLDKNGKVLSTVSKVYQAFILPQRDPADGKIKTQNVDIRYEAQM